MWEFCKLLEKSPLRILCDPEEWLATAFAIPRLSLLSVSPPIAVPDLCLAGHTLSDTLTLCRKWTTIEKRIGAFPSRRVR
jgi:hypothetical protein